MAFNNAPDILTEPLMIEDQAAPRSINVQWDHPRWNFFPNNWRTISEGEYNFWCSQAYDFCPEGHHLLQIFHLSLLSLIGIQKEIRQSGENLPAATLQHLEQVQSLLNGQLRIMKTGIRQGFQEADT